MNEHETQPSFPDHEHRSGDQPCLSDDELRRLANEQAAKQATDPEFMAKIHDLEDRAANGEEFPGIPAEQVGNEIVKFLSAEPAPEMADYIERLTSDEQFMAWAREVGRRATAGEQFTGIALDEAGS